MTVEQACLQSPELEEVHYSSRFDLYEDEKRTCVALQLLILLSTQAKHGTCDIEYVSKGKNKEQGG